MVVTCISTVEILELSPWFDSAARQVWVAPPGVEEFHSAAAGHKVERIQTWRPFLVSSRLSEEPR